MDGFKDKFVGFAATSLREIVSYIAFSFTVRLSPAQLAATTSRFVYISRRFTVLTAVHLNPSEPQFVFKESY